MDVVRLKRLAVSTPDLLNNIQDFGEDLAHAGTTFHQTSVTVSQSTRRNIPEDLNLKQIAM